MVYSKNQEKDLLTPVFSFRRLTLKPVLIQISQFKIWSQTHHCCRRVREQTLHIHSLRKLSCGGSRTISSPGGTWTTWHEEWNIFICLFLVLTDNLTNCTCSVFWREALPCRTWKMCHHVTSISAHLICYISATQKSSVYCDSRLWGYVFFVFVLPHLYSSATYKQLSCHRVHSLRLLLVTRLAEELQAEPEKLDDVKAPALTAETRHLTKSFWFLVSSANILNRLEIRQN